MGCCFYVKRYFAFLISSYVLPAIYIAEITAVTIIEIEPNPEKGAAINVDGIMIIPIFALVAPAIITIRDVMSVIDQKLIE